MKTDFKNIAIKSAKIAGATFAAAGAAALIASGAALKGITAGGQYLVETTRKILKEESVTNDIEVTTETVEESTPSESEEVAEATEAETEELHDETMDTV